jgi:CarD family transcriptional regulator
MHSSRAPLSDDPMTMYEIGEYVICRSGGVWRVTEIDGDSIRLLEHESGIMKVLTAGSGEIVRKIVSKETMIEAVNRIAYVRTIQASNDKARKKLYDDAMAEYDEIEWIKVIKTIYLRQKAKRLTPSEIVYSEKAKGYLHGEISVLLEIPMDKVENHIASAVSNDSW